MRHITVLQDGNSFMELAKDFTESIRIFCKTHKNISQN